MDPKIFSDMFSLSIPILEKIIRPIIVYIALIVDLRLAGKRELAQLNPFDLVVLPTLSNTVQNAIIGDDSSVTGGLIGAATLLVVNYLDLLSASILKNNVVENYFIALRTCFRPRVHEQSHFAIQRILC